VVAPGNGREEGLVLGWLLVAFLGIIWVAFLIPSRRRSPVSSIEEFEQRMSMLAETNSKSPGRWVLMPRKDRGIMSPRDQQRARVRRRRRQVFMVLLEATTLTFLMGLFPPLRMMLYGTAILALLLLSYALVLAKIREDELERARLRPPIRTNGHAEARANGLIATKAATEKYLREGGVNVLEEDVHVIVRRSDEIDVSVLQQAAR
jgi:type II secretory pathway component PulM